MSNYQAKIVNMPPKVHSFVIREQEYETIVINARLSFEQQLKCYQHELKHIENDDFEKESLQEIETKAHGKDEI